jgi:hypothetical protein
MRSMNTESQNNPKVAIAAAVLCITFVVFVFVYDDLKTNTFVQGITSLLVALTIAVVLFSAVRGSKVIRLPLGVAGAAGFYLLLLPQVKPFVFPFYSFAGYVAQQEDHPSEKTGTFTPLEGADVEIKDTGLHSTTNPKGQFTISQIPSQITVTHLIISRGGQSHTVEIKKYPDKIFRIPADPRIIKSRVSSVNSNEWTQGTRTGCVSESEKKSPYAAQFLLTKTVQNDEGYADFVLRVWSDDEKIEIVDAREQQPTKGRKVTELNADSKAQKWLVPVEGRTTTIRLYVCLGTNDKKTSLSSSKLKSLYWFEKVG